MGLTVSTTFSSSVACLKTLSLPRAKLLHMHNRHTHAQRWWAACHRMHNGCTRRNTYKPSAMISLPGKSTAR